MVKAKKISLEDEQSKAKASNVAKKSPKAVLDSVVKPVKIPTSPKIDNEKNAKAGKRSAKAIAQFEEKQAKELLKSQKPTTKPTEPEKTVKTPSRSKVERAGKKYREASKLVDKAKLYGLPEAIELAIKTSPTKFDATVELHLNLAVDPKQADQNIRGHIALPAGRGKTVRVAVLAEDPDAVKAKKNGADIANADELFEQLDKEVLNFDVLVATPTMMPKLGKYAKLLGPRGLMPNPKSGTVTNDVLRAVTEAKSGRIEYRTDEAGIIHLGVGKVSFEPSKLKQNLEAVLSAIQAARPPSVKGPYIKSVYLSTTMGPSIKLSID